MLWHKICIYKCQLQYISNELILKFDTGIEILKITIAPIENKIFDINQTKCWQQPFAKNLQNSDEKN